VTFKKQFTKHDFLDALSFSEWQKTSVIAEKVGCKRDHVTKTLKQMEEVESRPTKGGREGTREWRKK
jgi:hypothetical protein